MNLVSESAGAMLRVLAEGERLSAQELLGAMPGELTRGALCTLLTRMAERGWITVGERKATTPDARPTDRLQITGEGRSALAQDLLVKQS